MARHTSKSSQATINHDEIRAWAEERGGTPAVVRATHNKEDSGILRIDFGEPEQNLEPVSWEEFFTIFDERGLAFLYQDETSDGGERSFFFKLVARDNTPPEVLEQEGEKKKEEKKKDGGEGGDDDEEEDEEDDEEEGGEEKGERDEDDAQA